MAGMPDKNKKEPGASFAPSGSFNFCSLPGVYSGMYSTNASIAS